MKYTIEEKDLEDVSTLFDDLSRLLTERVSDLYEVKGGKQPRHAFMFYRSKLSEIEDQLNNYLKPESKTK